MLDVVMVAKKECLSCKHLCEQSKTKYDCTDEQNCPANTYKIVIGLNILDYSERLAEAMKNNDVTVIAEITEELKDVDAEVKNKVLTLAKQKL